MRKTIAILLAMAVFIALGASCRHLMDGLRECPASPKPGVWYKLTPEGEAESDGSRWHGQIRFGTENKLMVYLLGGGVSLDAYSAARSASSAGDDGFYYDRDNGISAKRVSNGIGSMAQENPFRNWTVILVPYSTGAFHAGSGSAPYTTLDARDALIYHTGYTNCMRLLDMALAKIEKPDALLITGYSAGGFGAAMLADDILSRFGQVENATVCVDSALLINERWHEIARDRWHAPQHILNRTASDNLTLDHLSALYDKYGDAIRILFTCSARDGGLARYQSYIDGNGYTVKEAYGDVMQQHLTEMIAAMQNRIPSAGIYVWDDIPLKEKSLLTKHTILSSKAVFESRNGGISIADWMHNAVNGQVESIGLQILE